jgi:plasmid maintenance system killer protein
MELNVILVMLNWRLIMSLKKELDVVCKALIVDPGYYYSWQANIAMAFKDEWERQFIYKDSNVESISSDFIHKVSNQAAKNFLNLLIREVER